MKMVIVFLDKQWHFNRKVDLFLARQYHTIILLLEPLHGLFLVHPMLGANAGCPLPPVGDVEAWSTQHYIEVHAIDTNVGIVLDAQVNVLLDSKTKVASVREVVAPKLVLTHLKTPVQDLLGLGSSHSAVHRDLLISADSKGTHGVAGF